ncbi:MAG: hypothetical protein J5902_05200 [Paludibacteraceae bacterium]|nr:hypothetical protein [Paludibacteraceae bacterium]
MGDEQTYQPDWGKPKKHHRHHQSQDPYSKAMNRGVGGALRMKDKQAYYGLLFILAAAVLVAVYMFAAWLVAEIRSMPMDNSDAEMRVDELRIHKADEQDALMVSDSLAKMYNLDSLRHKVQIETTPVYRPPRKENKWYITGKEWKEIWHNWKIWKKAEQEGETE